MVTRSKRLLCFRPEPLTGKGEGRMSNPLLLSLQIASIIECHCTCLLYLQIPASLGDLHRAPPPKSVTSNLAIAPAIPRPSTKTWETNRSPPSMPFLCSTTAVTRKSTSRYYSPSPPNFDTWLSTHVPRRHDKVGNTRMVQHDVTFPPLLSSPQRSSALLKPSTSSILSTTLADFSPSGICST